MERSFRPSTALLFSRLVRVAGIAVFAGISPLVFAGSHFVATLVTDLTALAVIAVGLFAYARLSLRNTRVDSAPGRLRVGTFVGTSHDVAPHHLSRVVVARAVVTPNGQNRTVASARLFVLDETGHSVLRWSENAWTAVQMRELAESLALPTDSIDEPISRRELIERTRTRFVLARSIRRPFWSS